MASSGALWPDESIQPAVIEVETNSTQKPKLRSTLAMSESTTTHAKRKTVELFAGDSNMVCQSFQSPCLSLGTSTGQSHLGQRIEFPASSRGTRNSFLQRSHVTSIDSLICPAQISHCIAQS